jgi:Protein of unknown function (DUF1499)
MPPASPTRPIPLSLWARRCALFGLQLLITAMVLHRFASLPTPAMLGAFKVAGAAGFAAVILALAAIRIIWRKGGKGVGAALVGSLAGLTLLSWPAAPLVSAFRTPAITDITTDTQSPPQFRDLARLRDPGANPITYARETLAGPQAQAYPDIRTMVVTRPGQESFDLTREIIRRMKWVEVAARPPANATATGEIEARSITPVLGFRDDVVIRLKGERDRTRIDIRSASPHGQHDLGRNAARVRALMQELHTRLDLGVPLEPEVVAKRRSIRKKLLQQQARGQVTAGQPGSAAGQPQSSAPRERVQKPAPRSPDENPAPGKRRRQSWE